MEAKLPPYIDQQPRTRLDNENDTETKVSAITITARVKKYLETKDKIHQRNHNITATKNILTLSPKPITLKLNNPKTIIHHLFEPVALDHLNDQLG